MCDHLPDENVYRLRCELELELRRSLRGAEFSSLQNVDRVVAAIVGSGRSNELSAAIAKCCRAYVALVHGEPGAIDGIAIAIDTLAKVAGERHFETVRYRWLLCRLLHDKGDASWHRQVSLLSWLGSQDMTPNRMEAWVRHQAQVRGIDLTQ
jgi:hypothetical protein